MKVPRWFGALLVAVAGGVVGAGLVGLLLAIAGAFAWPVALGAGVLGGLAGAVAGWRWLPAGGGHGWAAAAVVVAVAFVVANWGLTGETVVLERDPGLYSATARWLDRDGSLLVDAAVGPFADAPDVSFRSVGMYTHGDDGTLEFQADHLTPALLAIGYGAAGAGGLFRVPLVLVACGLLAVYALAVRVTGRAEAALAAMVAFAVSMPVLGVARDTLSEPAVLLLLWAGLWLWTVAADGDDARPAAVAGLCLGAALATRIDAAAYLVPVPIVLALHGRRSGWRLPLALAAGLVPGALATALDVGLRSRGYLGDLKVEVGLLYGLLAASAVVGVAIARWRRPVRIPKRLPDVAAAIVVVVLLGLWFVRPHVQTVRAGSSGLVENVQRGHDMTVDGARRYHEDSMVWQSWYLGVPIVAAAIAGAAIVVRRIERAVLLPLTALGAATALYLWRPAISPDQLWAMRRFVPAALPLWCVLAAVTAVTLVGRRLVVAIVAAVVAIGPVVARTWPVREFREFDGFLSLVQQTCDVVGPDGAVVAPEDDYAGASLTQTIRSWCGVPAAVVDEDADVSALGDAWAADGRQLWLVVQTDTEADLQASTDRMLDDTLTSPPDGYFTHRLGLVLTRVGGG